MLQFSALLRSKRLDQIELTLGAGPTLRIMAGVKPSTCAISDGSNKLLCQIKLPSDWMETANGGTKIMKGVWSGYGAAIAGEGTKATYFRLLSGTAVHMQGSISVVGHGGEMILDDTIIVAGEPCTVTIFTLTDGNIG